MGKFPASWDPLGILNQWGQNDLTKWVPPAAFKAANTPAPPPPPPPGGGGGGGYSGPSMATKKKTAANLVTTAKYNAGSARNQFGQAKANYDLADTQNRQLADVQFDQNSEKAAGDRFAQMKKLQGSTRGILSAAGNALQGSGAGNVMGMLRGRTDLDNNEALGILKQNQNATRNALDESINANVLARNDAASTAELALRGVESDTAAQLNSIDPKLFKKPGAGSTNMGSKGFTAKNLTPANVAARAGYILPAATSTVRSAAAPTTGGSYFDTLINSYNRRS